MFLAVSGLVGEKQDDGLQALLSTLQGFEKTLKVGRHFPAVLLASHETVNVVTQKEVVAFRWKATIPAHSKFERNSFISRVHELGSYKWSHSHRVNINLSTADSGIYATRCQLSNSKRRRRSWYWPWTSPQIFKGASNSYRIWQLLLLIQWEWPVAKAAGSFCGSTGSSGTWQLHPLLPGMGLLTYFYWHTFDYSPKMAQIMIVSGPARHSDPRRWCEPGFCAKEFDTSTWVTRRTQPPKASRH